MMRVGHVACIGLLCLGVGCAEERAPRRAPTAGRDDVWRAILADRVATYGHRNWIVIVDSAYPLQSRPGIETVATNAEQMQVLRRVLKELGHARHVRPQIYLDAELPYVQETEASGIDAYRKELREVLAGRQPVSLPHEQIIDRLDRAAEKFKVLVLKTNLTLPYTSVFLELECGYWSPEAEKRLRAAVKADK